MKKRLSLNEYVNGILDGNRIILSQAITIIESSKTDDIQLAHLIIEKILPYTGKSKRIGITGVPGVGKSTFIESFGNLLTEKGFKIAVLTVDPSSQKTKGSILGDKTRMETLSTNPLAYIRPSASGKSLGGVTNNTREIVLLCEAAGFEIILIETVGVGQSEVAVKNMTDLFLLLMLAGAGDELQGIKRGIMEMADIIAITKADGDNINKAKAAKIEYENALHLFPPNTNNWTSTVQICSAINNSGIRELWDKTISYFELIESNGFLKSNRKAQNHCWFKDQITMKLQQDFYSNKSISENLSTIENKIDSTSQSISSLVEEAFKLYKK